MERPPVFITGSPRSGTSILYRALQLHSSFKPHNFRSEVMVELTESRAFRDPYSLGDGGNSKAFAYMLKDKEAYSKFFLENQNYFRSRSFLPKKNFLNKLIPELKLPIDRARSQAWHLSGNEQLLKSFFAYAKQARGVARIVEKTPEHIMHLPEIKQTFPDCKIIFMARHPIDVFSSYRKRLKRYSNAEAHGSQLNWLRISSTKFCSKYFHHSHLALQEQKRSPHQFLVLKYEDFIDRFEEDFQHLLSFLGESLEDISLNQESRKINWVDNKLFAPISPSPKDWNLYLSEQEVDFIENRLSMLMTHFGYKSYRAL